VLDTVECPICAWPCRVTADVCTTCGHTFGGEEMHRLVDEKEGQWETGDPQHPTGSTSLPSTA
jgi:hypothetical protein